MIALADCNNFYVSCERVFNPSLKNKPIVVLSNNDGCIISRSDEAKKIGIKMGEPVFKIKDLISKYDVQLFSTNFALYGDMSSRVMSLLSQFSPSIEIYSVDEAFIDFSGIDQRHLVAGNLITKIKKSTGIPISIGVARTKTLAKIANHIAKKYSNSGFFALNSKNYEISILKKFPISKVWGIGYKRAKMLSHYNIYSAYDFIQLNEGWVKKNMSITGLQLLRELKGEKCFSIDKYPRSKKNISSSRTFSNKTDNYEKISKHISRNVSRCAKKLREQKSCAGFIGVSIRTSPHDYKQEYLYLSRSAIIDTPTNNTIELIKISMNLLKSIYKENINYSKSKVFIGDIVPSNRVQTNLFDSKKDRRKLDKSIDTINCSMGRNTIQVLSSGIKKSKQSNNMSPRYTTRWDELLEIS
tara:strand:- start:9966 stop:11204 length:1239 start_codon:yes stop_codon:yes gene_type:complete